jgi:AcrR family transcriptional regulator
MPSPSPSAKTKRKAPRGRPRRIPDEQILDVARKVFLERGIQATTSEVASRAEVSEGTIFHRYKSKDGLFRAAMRFDPEALPGFVESLTAGSGEGDLRARLLQFAWKMLELGRTAVPMMMMSWSNPVGEYRLETLIERSEGYRRTLRAVVAFFARELSARRQPADPPEPLTYKNLTQPTN